MRWTGPEATPATVRVAAVLPTLNASERRVARCIAEEPEVVVGGTAQELAARIGVARSTVVRTCQSLGYPGYPQLRVALARELDADPAPSSGELGRLAAAAESAAAGMRALSRVVTDEQLDRAVDAIAAGRRVLVLGSGFSGPLAAEASLRLTVTGRPADTVADGFAQRVSASQLRHGDVCLLISADGTDSDGITAARSAAHAGAAVVVLTAVARSPITAFAQTSLVAPPVPGPLLSQQDQTSRLTLGLLVEALVDAVARRRAEPVASPLRIAAEA